MPYDGFRITVQQYGHNPASLLVERKENGSWYEVHKGNADAADLHALVEPVHAIAPTPCLESTVHDIISTVAAAQEERVDQLLAELEQARDVARVYKDAA